MLTLVLRRMLAQRRLLVGIIALVTLGTTLLGVGALLLGTTQDRAFTAGVRQVTAQDVDVTAYLVNLKSSNAVQVRDDARAVVGDALHSMRPTLTSNWVSRMRRIGDGHRLGYLESTDSLTGRATLTSGRWTRAAGEAVVPRTTADRLHLALGDRMTLGREVGTEPVEEPVTVVIVGTFRSASRTGWLGDPLVGSGYDATYSDGSLAEPTPAFGPFVVDDATFLASGSTVDALQVIGHPAVANVTDASMSAAAEALRSADGLLSARVGDVVQISRVASDLPQTLHQMRTQQAATRSTVLVVLLLGTTLALTGLLLAGRLLAGVRETERDLLMDLGLGRGQLVRAAVVEALVVAAVATALAVPAAALAHSATTQLSAMASAGLSQHPTVTSALVLTEIAGALLLALALVVPALVPALPRSRIVTAARFGIDLLLVVIVLAAWWQLHSPPSTVISGDLTRTLAPVICVAAATAVAVRCAPVLLALLARMATRSTALVLPLASSQAARRPYAGAALILIAMAAASATFGIALQTTWQRSQGDQAALRVGTDLALALSGPVTDRDATSITTATAGSAASAVTDRPLALGRYVGETGSPPLLVAVDSHRAGALLRGRLDRGRTSSDVGDLLAPGRPVAGLPLPSDRVAIMGSAPAGVAVDVTPTLVVQDASGLRRTVSGEPVPLDGKRHAFDGPGLGGTRLVATRLTLSAGPDAANSDAAASGASAGAATVSVAVVVPGSKPGSDDAPKWVAHTLDPGQTPVAGSAVAVRPSGSGTAVRTTARLDLGFLAFASGDVLATAFSTPDALPVAVSQRLADHVGLKVGGELSATVGGVEVPVRVVTVIPTVPSAPGRGAMLADSDTLSRRLIGAGDLEPAVDGWWVADPTAQTTKALTGLGLGDVTTRAGVATELRQGPLRVSVPTALTLLVVVAGLLLLAGTALVVAADRPARSTEVARLRALGLSRRGAVRLVLTEHGILLGLLVVTGTLVGVVAAIVLGPDLIRSEVGTAPVPAAAFAWPWLAGVSVVTGLLVGCLVIAAAITFVAVRRSGPAQLRVAD